MLKHVTPADPTASIPDPDRGGFLPSGGAPVTWSAHWAGLARRRDVTVTDIAPKALPEPEIVPESVEAEASAA